MVSCTVRAQNGRSPCDFNLSILNLNIVHECIYYGTLETSSYALQVSERGGGWGGGLAQLFLTKIDIIQALNIWAENILLVKPLFRPNQIYSRRQLMYSMCTRGELVISINQLLHVYLNVSCNIIMENKLNSQFQYKHIDSFKLTSRIRKRETVENNSFLISSKSLS